MPEPDRVEFNRLLAHPNENASHLLQMIDRYYGLAYVYPEISNEDWIALGVLLLGSVPLIAICGWWMSRPASKQFLHVAHSAREVAQGDFSARSPVIPSAPEEFRRLALDFNEMTMKLERYEQEVQASSAIVAHELRTPLNAAIGRLQGMLDGVFPADAQQLQMVMHRLGMLNRLVDELHLLSLARAGHLVLERNRFYLDELVMERLSWATQHAERETILVNRNIDSTLEVVADRSRLGQVFSILIENAIRYASDGGVLDICATASGEWLTIDFGDRGPGVAPEHLGRMFDRFWRAEESRARHSGGSGLGLSIAFAICTAHKGSLTAINRDGSGTLMRIQLPL